jgi:acetyl esterase/lipase
MLLARCVAAMFLAHCAVTSFAEDGVTITPDIVYGHKDGMALTFDLLVPEHTNGATILFLRSGAWYSVWSDPQVAQADWKLFLDHGFQFCIVRHGSAPKYTVPEAAADVRLCVRFLHQRGAELGIDPQRLGVCGESAGGHLTLLLATTGDDGDPAATNEVLRHSSRISTGVAIAPPTDLRGWTTNPPEEIAKIDGLGPPLDFDSNLESAMSPLLHVTPDDASVLLIHGDKDLVVPIEHSQNILKQLQAAHVESRLFVAAGAGHGFSPGRTQQTIRPEMLRWFQERLVTPSPKDATVEP